MLTKQIRTHDEDYFSWLANGDPTAVSFDRWIRFWFRGANRYDAPALRSDKRKVTSLPKDSQNPSPTIKVDSSILHTNPGIEPLGELQVPKELQNEVYLAAFLSCWICKFLLPGNPIDTIRPGVFKVACLLATGVQYSLAIPVLCSIYRGLNEIVQSLHLLSCKAVFPIHFVYAWMARHFGTHFHDPSLDSEVGMVKFHGERMAQSYSRPAAIKLLEGSTLNFNTFLTPFNNKHTDLVDTVDLSFRGIVFLHSIRSCYLTFRQGANFLTTSYSPHRFSRQFGFCQDIPGVMKVSPRYDSLADLRALWKSSIRLNTGSTMIVPARSSISFCTEEYIKWWESITHQFKVSALKVPSVTHNSIANTSPKTHESSESTSGVSPDCHWKRSRKRKCPTLETSLDPVESIPMLEVPDSAATLEALANYDFEGISTMGDLLGLDLIEEDAVAPSPSQPQDEQSYPVSQTLESSVVHHSSGIASTDSNEFDIIKCTWQGIKDVIRHTPIDSLSSLEEHIMGLVNDIHDPRILKGKTSLTNLFNGVRDYIAAKLSYDNMITAEAHHKRVSEFQRRMEVTEISIDEMTTELDGLQSKLPIVYSKLLATRTEYIETQNRHAFCKKEIENRRSHLEVDKKMAFMAKRIPFKPDDKVKKSDQLEKRVDTFQQVILNLEL